MSKNVKIAGIIPARYASSRFPGKPLALINGISMIQRVYELAAKAKFLSDVVVATDDDRIAEHVISFGGKVVMTASTHISGTDRCFEALQKLGSSYSYVINIQGDEPFLAPDQIDELAAYCDEKNEILTQMIKVKSYEELFDSGEVKIVLNQWNEALYFSREPIPHVKNKPKEIWHECTTFYRHVGMYAYRADILEKLVKVPPHELEIAESLEQLRWLAAGFKIKCIQTKYESHCVDTPEDIERILRLTR